MSVDRDGVEVGDVVQITDASEGGSGWLGALVLVTEVKSFGVQGYVHHIDTHGSSRAYIRLRREQYERIGKAALFPADEISPR